MDFSTLDLDYKVRRAKLDHCEGLKVFPHDLDCMCIPIQHADRLAKAYKRYLAGAGMLDWRDDPDCDEQEVECDRFLIGFFHERDKTPFIPGEFHLGAAIDFIFFEAQVSSQVATRWCMLMEYLIWQDQQMEAKREPDTCGPDEQSEAGTNG